MSDVVSCRVLFCSFVLDLRKCEWIRFELNVHHIGKYSTVGGPKGPEPKGRQRLRVCIRHPSDEKPTNDYLSAAFELHGSLLD